MPRIKYWLAQYWVAGAAFMAVSLLLLLPVISSALPLTMLLIYLHLPGYMIHQVEEHSADRFRKFVNNKLFGGVEALTVDAVLWINLPGVWGVNLIALYAAVFINPGYGLAAPYLMLVNAVSHIASSLKMGRYNPGLRTSFIIFLPLGLFTLYMIPATAAQQVLGLGISLVIHAAIVVNTVLHAKRLHALQRRGWPGQAGP